jgi:hypothetical protein
LGPATSSFAALQEPREKRNLLKHHFVSNGLFKRIVQNRLLGKTCNPKDCAMAVSDRPVDPVKLIDLDVNGGVDAATTLQVRKTIYSHDPLTPSDMELVFQVARQAGSQRCAEWTSLFCEALTDYVVHQNVPRDYIPQDKADWLVADLKAGGGISSKAEFAMLIEVMTRALGVPTSLSTFVLHEIATAILQGRRGPITGEDHPAGVVTKVDVEALRAVLYAAKTGTPEHVTREEAEVLFEIAHATSQAQVDPSFDELFSHAVGNYLMATSFHIPDVAEALHVEKWLDEKETLSGFLSRMVQHPPTLHSFNVFKSPDEDYRTEMARHEADDAALRSESEKITDSEAAWMIAHLTRDGGLTSAEKRLLQFIKAEAPSIAPSLQELIERADLVHERQATAPSHQGLKTMPSAIQVNYGSPAAINRLSRSRAKSE